MAKNFTQSQVKELLDMHENFLLKIFNERFQKLENDFLIIRDENKQLKKELDQTNSTIQFLSDKYEIMKETLNNNKNKISSQDNFKQKATNLENEYLKDKMAELEDRSRRNNLRFEGIEETEGETWKNSEEKVRKLIKEKLNINEEIHIERAYRTGKKENEDGSIRRRRTVVVKFLDYKDRENILENYKKLKLWNEKIYINEDFSERTTIIRKQLFIKAKEIRSSGNFAKVVYNKLITKSFKKTI
ncbi:uncharacterized protein LOC136083361 [Hydra vulgaris]|uniref:Uncharacterized protein LOC136083361 n=1 Tax=Hydra vulgaris TaxID=6087 RepID=A0ABM4CB18_HYDVU